MNWPLGIIAFLAIGTAVGFLHAHTQKMERQYRASSNARVLREFKRMSIHQPEKIIEKE